VLDMRPPKNVKDIQKLTGCMAAHSRFISRLGEKGLPFFKLLKASERFSWTEEADAVFTQLKTFLTSPPVLTAPQPNEDSSPHHPFSQHLNPTRTCSFT